MRPFQKTYHPFRAGARGRTSAPARWATWVVTSWTRHSRSSNWARRRASSQPEAYNFLPPVPGERGFGKRVEYNDSYPPSSIIDLVFPGARQSGAGEIALPGAWPLSQSCPTISSRIGSCRNRGRSSSASKGKMWCGTHSESPRLIPQTFMQAFQRPPRTLPRVPDGRSGHGENWLDAIRQKGQAVSSFDYAGPFTSPYCSATWPCVTRVSGSCGTRPT